MHFFELSAALSELCSPRARTPVLENRSGRSAVVHVCTHVSLYACAERIQAHSPQRYLCVLYVNYFL